MIISYYMMKIIYIQYNHTNAEEVNAHLSSETQSMEQMIQLPGPVKWIQNVKLFGIVHNMDLVTFAMI